MVVVNDLREFNHNVSPCIVPCMYQYINTIQTISSIRPNGGDRVYFFKNNKHLWNALWLSPIIFDKEIWK